MRTFTDKIVGGNRLSCLGETVDLNKLSEIWNHGFLHCFSVFFLAFLANESLPNHHDYQCVFQVLECKTFSSKMLEEINLGKKV